MLISVVVPVYQRPEELDLFLSSLSKQTDLDFEVVIVENGTKNLSDKVVHSFSEQLNIQYVTYPKGKQGGARNYGMSVAKGDFFVLFDSDTIVPQTYMADLKQKLNSQPVEAYGGADALYPTSTLFQKAADYVMTGFMTTGGTRGAKKKVGKFYARSFNMGLSRAVFEKTKGFKYPHLGEDMEFSRRIMENGFSIALFSDLVVYHERKRSPKGLFQQLHFFGRARIALYKQFKDMLKPMHLLPVLFTLGILGLIGLTFININLAKWASFPLLGYLILVFLEATFRYKNPIVGLWSIFSTFILMIGYGLGFITEYMKRMVLKKQIPEHQEQVFLDV